MNIEHHQRVSRREFILGSLALGGISILPKNILAQGKSPNEKPNIVVIGGGVRGILDARDVVQGANIVAFCDVDQTRAAACEKLAPGAPFFQDYRKMYDQVGKQIDGVLIATPDHAHFHLAMRAVQEKKHVYCEKPLTQTISEARRLRLAAKEAGVVTQMGNQGHCGDGIRLLQEWYEAGVLGEVRKVVLMKRRGLTLSRYATATAPTAAPPAAVDWENWIGPRPMIGFDKNLHPRAWRCWWNYGCGTLGDFGCHFMDAAVHALQLGAPVSVTAESTGATAFTFPPEGQKITFQFPARGEHAPVELIWMDGDRIDNALQNEFMGKPPAATGAAAADDKGASRDDVGFIIGDKATVQQNMYASYVRIVPEEKMRDLRSQLPPKRLPRIKGGPVADWLAGIRGETVPCSNFEVAGRLTETVLAGNLALRANKSIQWDSEKMITGDPAVDKFVQSPPPRSGWEV